MDKAGKKYWEDSWAGADLPAPVDPRDMRLKNRVNRLFHRKFSGLFGGALPGGSRLLEVGCAKSAWLPYFSREFGLRVAGLDYSPAGCELARQVLGRSGVEGEIICADLFSPPQALAGAFDAAVSFGVAEHFDDTAACIKAVASLVKPGGLIVTSVPNLTGWIGAVQKLVNRPVYDIHRLLSPESLRAAHGAAGLEVAECGYFISSDFGVNNLTGLRAGTASWLLKKVLLGLLARASMLLWLFEEAIGELPANRLSSPYIVCVARRPLK